jgi:predicted lipoprotein with Yx(FWY)xxD motif
MKRSLLWTRKLLAIMAVASIAMAVVAAGCGGGTSSADKTATAAAKAPATATKPPSAATATKPPSTATAQPAGSATAPAATGTASAAATTVKIGQAASLGSVLTDPAGKTLYTFKNDVPNSGQSSVPANIAAAWPPVLVTGSVVAPSGLSGQLGSFSRPDGSKQVMYKGMPLYTYVGDTASGQANGQGLGGVWFAATP